MKSPLQSITLGIFLLTGVFSPADEIVLFDTSNCDVGKAPNRLGTHLESGMRGEESAYSQPFRTGNSTNINSVTVDVGVFRGSPTGQIGIEIWEDDGTGIPGSRVELLGSIDVTKIPSASLEPHILTTVEGTVTGLRPNSQYHVVFEHERVEFGTRGAIIYTTCRFDEGTKDADNVLGLHPIFSGGKWEKLIEGIGPARAYFVMKVTSAQSHTLTTSESNEGTVTKNPNMDVYIAGTEVTLTATPNEGYELSKWQVGETEYVENPLTITIDADTMVTPVYVAISDALVLYDNLNEADTGRGVHPPTWGEGGCVALFAQPFLTGDSNNVSSVTLETGILKGTPTGQVLVEIWDADDSGNPNANVGTLGEFDLTSLPDAHLEWGYPRVDGLVAGLKPDTRYYMMLNFEDALITDDDHPIFSTIRTANGTKGADKFLARVEPSQCQWIEVAIPNGPDRNFLSMTLTAAPSHKLTIGPNDHGVVTNSHNMETYPAGLEIILTARPNKGYQFSKWLIGEDEFEENPVAFTIEADTTVTPEFVESDTKDPFIIDKTDEGFVTADPDLVEYLIGSQVTVSATPEPGFEFVKWLYGDEEFTTNPATITVVAGATLTPKFAPVESEPKPIDVEILPAMAIRWDSQVGRTYEVQSSPNLQDWTVEAENVQGTGDTLTHFFIRDAREMYYRVMEN